MVITPQKFEYNYYERGDIIMRNKLIILVLIVLYVVSVKDDSKEAYRSTSGLTVKI